MIRRHNIPVAKLVPFRPVAVARKLGGWEGKVVIHDDFDELPVDIAAVFDGKPPREPSLSRSTTQN